MFIQGLYYANFYEGQKSNKDLEYIVKKTFLKNYETPFIIYTGTNNIDFSRITQDTPLLKLLSKHNQIDIFLYEPLSYRFKNQKHNLGFYSEFDHKLNSNTNLRADELDSITKLQRKIGKENIHVNLCDYRIPKQLKNYYSPLKLVCRDLFFKICFFKVYTTRINCL